MYDREKDIDRRVAYLLAAELANLKDIFLKRARDLAKAQGLEVTAQDAAAAGFEQARAEYEALGGSKSPSLPSGE